MLRSGWITTGARNAELEAGFREYSGCLEAASVSSATGGMHLVLTALGIGPGDEVITPSMTWVSTVNLIVLAGARPVFADVDRDTLMVTPEAVSMRADGAHPADHSGPFCRCTRPIWRRFAR